MKIETTEVNMVFSAEELMEMVTNKMDCEGISILDENPRLDIANVKWLFIEGGWELHVLLS